MIHTGIYRFVQTWNERAAFVTLPRGHAVGANAITEAFNRATACKVSVTVLAGSAHVVSFMQLCWTALVQDPFDNVLAFVFL